MIFAIPCLVLCVISYIGNRTVNDTTILLQDTLKHNIESLSQINAAQYQLANLRVLEMSLTRYQDAFVVSGAIDRIRVEIQKFDGEIQKLSLHYIQDASKWSSRLNKIWAMYRRAFDRTLDLAAKMELNAAESHVSYNSGPSFQNLSNTLKQLSDQIESRAREQVQAARGQLTWKQTTFLTLSASGIALSIIFAVLLARSLSRRLSLLRNSAVALTDGRTTQMIPTGGHDEIAELGKAFNVMTQSLDQMTQAQQRRLEELYALHQIGLVLNSTHDSKELGSRILDAMRQYLHLARIRLFLVESDRQVLVCRGMSGMPRALYNQFQSLAIPLQTGGTLIPRSL